MFSSLSRSEVIRVLSVSLLSRVSSLHSELFRMVDRLIIAEDESQYKLAEDIYSIQLKLNCLLERSPYWTTYRVDEEDIDASISRCLQLVDEIMTMGKVYGQERIVQDLIRGLKMHDTILWFLEDNKDIYVLFSTQDLATIYKKNSKFFHTEKPIEDLEVEI